jgi:hypothetical protein
LGNRVGVAPGVDVRSDGGYVVAPPSVIDGTRGYAWEASPWTTEVARIPNWLHAKLAQRPRQPYTRLIATARPGGLTRYGKGAVSRECERLSQAPKGTRNNALNVAACCLGRLIEPCGLDGERVVHALVNACRRNGLVQEDGLRKVSRTIQSGLLAGMAKPRAIELRRTEGADDGGE